MVSDSFFLSFFYFCFKEILLNCVWHEHRFSIMLRLPAFIITNFIYIGIKCLLLSPRVLARISRHAHECYRLGAWERGRGRQRERDLPKIKWTFRSFAKEPHSLALSFYIHIVDSFFVLFVSTSPKMVCSFICLFLATERQIIKNNGFHFAWIGASTRQKGKSLPNITGKYVREGGNRSEHMNEFIKLANVFLRM